MAAACAALLACGVVVGVLVVERSGDLSGSSGPASSAEATTVSPSELSSRTQSSEPVRSGALVTPPVEVDEPVGFVAQRLGPSVVQVETDQGQGSGVVFRDGLILTNNHVIAGTSGVQVRLADGRVVAAELVGSDERIDIAVLRVGDVPNLPVAELALDGDLDVGHLVVAIGSPFQLQQTVTSGVVSAINRPVPNGVLGSNAMIQTDTAINPGNSGGALADRQGRVVGINTSGRTDGASNSNIGIGFAVPIETAVATADRLLAGESMSPGVLGISPNGADSSAIGVLIDRVEPGSAAERAGLVAGDRVISIDGLPVPSADVLAAIVQNHFGGDAVVVIVDRDGSTELLDVVLA